MASLFVLNGELTLEHCTFTNALSPAKPGLGLNTSKVNLRDTDLQGLIHEFGGASTVNDYGGSVWSSTTVGTTNYYGSALTVGGYTAAQLLDLGNGTNWPNYVWTNGSPQVAANTATQETQNARIGTNEDAIAVLTPRTNVWNSWVWTTQWMTNDPNRATLEVDAAITVTNLHGWLGGVSSVYDLYSGATCVYTGFVYSGSEGSTAVDIDFATAALMYLQITNGAPTNTAISIRGYYQ